MDAIQKIEHSESDAMADAVMEHLGPLALTHGHISPIDAFELGWNARAQTLASKDAEIARLREALELVNKEVPHDFDSSQEGAVLIALSVGKTLAIQRALTQPPKEPT